ncbi:MAG: pyruvate, phosphate dikinase [Solirubrobacteraceae bacterium]|nr:pyruvate, phosphate dikinase [Solirubrobacteraceae bacterium]
MSSVTWVQDFADGSREQRDLLGGKGANVAEMTRILGADRVPAGFTITTEACVAYMHADRAYPDGLEDQAAAALRRLEERTGKRLGDAEDPLLVSVRSGARESMPGMMDTVLNLGLNDRSVEGLAARTDNPRFAWDSYRRFVQMYGNVVEGVPSERIEERIAALKRERGVTLDTELDVDALRELVATFKALFRDTTGRDFPQDPQEQLDGAIRAVFDSWTGERAVQYRRINRIPDDWGTAVNVQQMVFGNKGDTSCSGVAFSRDEVTGEPTPSGDFLVNAQGEDVVSGVRNTQDLAEMGRVMPDAHAELLDILRTLERHYGDLQDTEFTVEEGRLYMLQTRNAKRPAQAAVRFAVDAVEEGLLTREQALLTLDAAALETLLHPTFDRSANYAVLGTGVNASPGAAKGAAVFTAEEAVHAAQRGERVILVRPFTEADDVAGFHAAQGILTSEGGKASHAALVARGMGKPCVCGATALQVDLPGHVARIGDTVIREGDLVAINGTTGEITTDDVPLVEPSQDPAMAPVLERFDTVLRWADELRVLGVRTNADTPEDAAKARELGAEGIGLCRTEHMFMEADRQPKMRRMIMAEHEAERRAALEELRPLQQADFEGLFEAMAGKPVTIRLLDPPLHEFLPKKEEVGEELHEAYASKRYHRVGVLADVLERIETLAEANPMLGTRGVRLGLLYPEIFEMQADAIFAAAVAVRDRGVAAGRDAAEAMPRLEVMIPLVGYERELEIMRGFVVAVGDRHGLTVGRDYLVGTMIELPRACFLADAIADYADFFSFGTNDLTQTGLGFSRDDIEGKILARYIEFKILDRSPFETIDTPGVGQMLRMGAWLGRKAKPDLKLGVCGEHGGDPDSIAFFHDSGIDYVSCSPFRVPIARIAAAQAAVRMPRG